MLRATSLHTSDLQTNEYLAESKGLANVSFHHYIDELQQTLLHAQRDLEEKNGKIKLLLEQQAASNAQILGKQVFFGFS